MPVSCVIVLKEAFYIPRITLVAKGPPSEHCCKGMTGWVRVTGVAAENMMAEGRNQRYKCVIQERLRIFCFVKQVVRCRYLVIRIIVCREECARHELQNFSKDIADVNLAKILGNNHGHRRWGCKGGYWCAAARGSSMIWNKRRRVELSSQNEGQTEGSV